MHLRIRAAVCSAAAAVALLSGAADSPAASDPSAMTGDKLVVMSDEAYAAQFGAGRARSEGLTALSAPAPVPVPVPLNRSLAAGSHWSVVRFVSTDGEGEPIPTREGNKHFGWQHFAEEHNIHDPKVIKIVTSEHPVKKGVRRECGGVLVNRLGTILARITVIAQYDYKTADNVHKLTDKSHKIGTITAYCERVARNKCPNAVNET